MDNEKELLRRIKQLEDDNIKIVNYTEYLCDHMNNTKEYYKFLSQYINAPSYTEFMDPEFQERVRTLKQRGENINSLLKQF